VLKGGRFYFGLKELKGGGLTGLYLFHSLRKARAWTTGDDVGESRSAHVSDISDRLS
jgi:hypothetical protein